MTFDVLSPGYMPYATLVGITLIAACIPLLWARKEGYAVVLRKSAIGALLVAPITFGIAFTVNKNTFEMSGQNISICAAYFDNYSGNLDNFDLDSAQVGSFQSIPEAKLKWRRAGIGLPGLNAGNFSTSDGRSIFVILTDASSVLYLPAKTGASLLISVRNPTEVLEVLKRAKSVP